jgi:hypothetical protein
MDLADPRSPSPPLARPMIRAAAAVLFVVVLMGLRLAIDPRDPFFLDDDAWYYHRIAVNIARHGFSSFDGLVATNGYHPLWQIVLSGAVLVFDVGARGVVVLQLVVLAAAVWVFLACVPRLGPLHLALVSLYLPLRIQGFVGHGMEVDVLFLALATWFVAMVRHDAERDCGSVHWLAATVGLCFLARIDAIVFVAPGALLIVRSNRARLVLFAEIAAIVGLYAAINVVLFGLPLPVSGAVKSLGGLQWNHVLAAQIFFDGFRPSTILTAPYLGPQLSLFGLSAALFLGFARRERLLVALHASVALGLAIYWTKLFLFSSWQIWPWYNFPVVVLVLVLVVTIDRIAGRLRTTPGRTARFVGLAEIAIAAGLAGNVGAAALLVRWAPAPHHDVDFQRMNAFVAAEVARRLGPVPIAMGDRAGSFAALHRGPVVQLEGLVSDATHLALLRSGGSIEARLCGLGVRHVLSYQRDLGDYDELDIPVIRPALAGRPSPTYHVRRVDEIFALRRPDLFDNSGTTDEDDTVRLWKIDCDRAAR